MGEFQLRFGAGRIVSIAELFPELTDTRMIVFAEGLEHGVGTGRVKFSDMVALSRVLFALEPDKIAREIEIVVEIAFGTDFDIRITAEDGAHRAGGHVAEPKGDKMLRAILAAGHQGCVDVRFIVDGNGIIEIGLTAPFAFYQQTAARFCVFVARVLPHDFDPRGIIADTGTAFFIVGRKLFDVAVVDRGKLHKVFPQFYCSAASFIIT